jgi:hypothetical protein
VNDTAAVFGWPIPAAFALRRCQRCTSRRKIVADSRAAFLSRASIRRTRRGYAITHCR